MNHTIISTGTFGWWGSWLANGETIYYSDEFDSNHPIVDGHLNKEDYYPSHWTALQPTFHAPNYSITLAIPALSRDVQNGNLDRLMNSAKDQSKQADEIIIALSNTSSTECQHVKQKYPNAYVHCDRNLNDAATSRNIAWSFATKDYISFMDADDYMFPERIETISKHLVDTKIILHKHGTNPSKLDGISRGSAWANITKLFGLSKFSRDNIAHGHVTVKRSIQTKFRENLNVPGEDVYFITDVLSTIDPSELIYIRKPLSWYIPASRQNNFNTTVVTAYFNVPSKYPHHVYMNWVKNLCNINDPVVIFTSKDQEAWFKKCRGDKLTVVMTIDLSNMKMIKPIGLTNKMNKFKCT